LEGVLSRFTAASLGAGELDGCHLPGGVDDVVDDVVGREHLGLLRR